MAHRKIDALSTTAILKSVGPFVLPSTSVGGLSSNLKFQCRHISRSVARRVDAVGWKKKRWLSERMPMEGHRKRPHIRLLRRRAGLSQRDLALLLGYRSHSQISRFENGSRLPAANELLQLEVIFGVVPSGVFPHLRQRAVEAVVARIAKLKRASQTGAQPSCRAVHLERILDSIRLQTSPGLNAQKPWPRATLVSETEPPEP